MKYKVFEIGSMSLNGDEISTLMKADVPYDFKQQTGIDNNWDDTFNSPEDAQKFVAWKRGEKGYPDYAIISVV